MRDVYISITINSSGRGKLMVQPGEARGRKSICTLVDLEDYDAACRRLAELRVPIVYHGNKPIVNIEIFMAASKKWFLKRSKGHSAP